MLEERSRARRLDRISTAAWLAISGSYADRLQSYIREAERNPDILNTQKALPPDWAAMGEAAKLFTRSVLLGLDSSVRNKEFAEPSAEDIENMPYTEAVEYLKKRSVIKKIDYDQLSNKMRFRAFTASRINDGKLLEKLNAEMISSVNSGKGLKSFLSLTKSEILDKIGMGAKQGWYWETVYRTNVQTAYNVGRMMGFAEDMPLALEFVGIDDSRQTDICHSLMGIVRPYNDPFWQTHIPPLHFNCRSTVRAIYDADELPAQWSSLEGIEAPAKGFGVNPLASDSWWKELEGQVRQAKQFGVQGEIDAAKVALELENEVEIKQRLVSKTISEEEQKQVEEIKQKFINNDYFLRSTNKYLTLDGMDVKSAQSVYDGFQKIFEMFPNMKTGLPAIQTRILPTNVFATTVIKNSQKQIFYNSLFYQDYDLLFKSYAESVANNFHPKGTTAIANTYHEFAHCLDEILTQRMTTKEKFKFSSFSEYALQEVLKLTGLKDSDIVSNVSKYAFKNAREWFAECLGEGVESPTPREMANTLMLFLKDFS